MSTFDQVRDAAADIFAIPAAHITPESSPETIASWDSMTHLSLVLALEEEFGVQFDPEAMEQMTSIAAAVKLVEKQLSAAR